MPLIPRVHSLLTNSEDDELGRLQHGDADLANKPAIVEIGLRHRAPITAHEIGLFRRAAEQRAVPPLGVEELADGFTDVGPKGLAVRLEDGPLGAAVDGGLDVVEIAADAHILPLLVARR